MSEESFFDIPLGFTEEEWEEALTRRFVRLSPALKTALNEIGFREDQIPRDINDKDAIEVLAFHKFLASGRWSVNDAGYATYEVDPDAFEYAKGKMDAKTFLLPDHLRNS